jgi:hypothetical protein
VTLEPVAKLGSDPFLQGFNLWIDKFDDLTGLHVDQMIMMFAVGRLVPRAAIAEFVLL